MQPNIESKLNQSSRISVSEAPQNLRGRLQNNEFEDFYRFKARSSSTLELSLSRLQRNANLEVYGLKGGGFQKVRKRLGNQPFRVISSKRIGRFLDRVGISRQRGKTDESITTSLEKGSTYLIRVFSKSRKGTKYRLSAASTPTSADFPDLLSLQPTVLNLPTMAEDSLSASNTVDLYEFSLGDRRQVSFNLSGLAADANLRLLDSDRREISTSSNAGIVEDSIVRNLRPDVYFIEVSGAPTEYRLSAQVLDQTKYALYSGEGTIFDQGQLSGFQIPLPRAQVEAIAAALNIPLSSIPPDFIAPRFVQEEQSPIGTTLNTAMSL